MTFLIWNLIFVLTGIYLIVLTIQITTKKSNSAFYLVPFLISFIINMIANGLWAVIWSQSLNLSEDVSLICCLVLLVVITITNLIMFVILYRNQSYYGRNSHQLEENIPKPISIIYLSDRCCIELLESIVNMGWISVYWSWSVFVMIINGVITLKYTGVWSDLACTICANKFEVTNAEIYLSLSLLSIIGLFTIFVTISFSNWGYALTVIWVIIGLVIKHNQMVNLSKYDIILLGAIIVLTIASVCVIVGFTASLLYSKGLIPTKQLSIQDNESSYI